MRGLEGIIGKIENFLSDHPKTAGTVSAAATFIGGSVAIIGLNEQILQDPAVDFLPLMLLPVAYGTGVTVYNNLKKSNSLHQLGLKYSDIKKQVKSRINRSEKKNLSLTRRIVDYACEHRVVAGTMLGAGLLLTMSAGIFAYTGKDPSNFVSALEKEPVLGAVCVALVPVMSFLFNRLLKLGAFYLHSSSSDYAAKIFKTVMGHKFSSEDKYFEKLNVLSKDSKYAIFRLIYATECARKDDTAGAFNALLDSYDKKDACDIPFAVSESLAKIRRTAIHATYENIKENPDSFPDYFILAHSLKTIGEKEKALRVMDDFLARTEKNPKLALNADLSYAVFMNKLGMPDRFSKQLERIIHLHEGRLEQIGTFKAYQFKDDDFSKRTFIFRKSKDKELLLSEIHYNKFLKEKFDEVNAEQSFRIIDPPQLIKAGDYFYSATFFEEGLLLSEHLESRPEKKMLEDIARFMARIHGSGGKHAPADKSFYVDQLISRFNHLPTLLHIKDILSDNVALLFEGFDEFSRVADIDGHRDNWIVGEHYTKIDNQYREPTLPFYECSKLLEQGNSLPKGDEGDAIKDSALKIYHGELSGFQSLPAFDEFLFHKLKSDQIKAASYFLFSYGDQTKRKTAREFLENSLHSAHRLRGFFSSAHDQKCLDNLESASLLMLNS